MKKLIAHRGYHKKYKENTMPSFIEALKKEYIGIECDLRETKDNILIIYHDPLYNGHLVKTTNFHEMDNVLLFSDFLHLKTNKIIIIDIKDPFINVNRIIDVMLNFDQDNIYLMSMYENVVKKLYNRFKKIKVGFLNFFFNNNDYLNKYDFLCTRFKSISSSFITKYRNELFLFNVKIQDIKNERPYYIVD